MSKPDIPEWLVKLIVMVALPAVTCFGLYSVAYLDSDRYIFTLPVILSYPVALIGIAGTCQTLISPAKNHLRLAFWIACIVIPVMIQVAVRST